MKRHYAVFWKSPIHSLITVSDFLADSLEDLNLQLHASQVDCELIEYVIESPRFVDYPNSLEVYSTELKPIDLVY